jgi:hypothetical protein
LQSEYLIWRLSIIEKVAPLNEIKYDWTVRDLMKAIAILNFQSDVEQSRFNSEKIKWQKQH